MSVIGLESNSGPDRIQRSAGFIHSMSSLIGSYDLTGGGDRRFSGKAAAAVEEDDDGGDSCSSSSIGKNSDDDDGDDEVESGGGGGLSNLNALEQVLPIKRGISAFYSGKSKSFTSLADAKTCSSMQDIAKPEDALTRKRKNLLAHSLFFDENRNSLSRSSSSGGITKRLASSSRSTLPLGHSVSSFGSSSGSSNNNDSSIQISPPPRTALPPLPPHGRRLANVEPSSSPPPRRSPWRSFSLSDLQHATSATTPDTSDTSSVMNNDDKEEDKLKSN